MSTVVDIALPRQHLLCLHHAPRHVLSSFHSPVLLWQVGRGEVVRHAAISVVLHEFH
jgi:hypothetical protein